jgi:hypothetical protein
MATLYSDLPLNFVPNPNTGDVKPATGERAVKLALQNLLRTPYGSKPYSPEYGTNITDYLFKQADEFTETDLIDDVADTIKRFEPRVDVVAIEADISGYGIEIVIEYYVKGFSELQEVTTVIDRA